MTMPAPPFEIDDRRYDPQAWVIASRKRYLLAVYVDYLIVGSLWALVQFLVSWSVPAVGVLPAWGRWVLFGLFELTATRFDGVALGARVLSMRRFSYRGAEGSGRPLRGRMWFVDAWVKRHESWLSMIPAFLFVSDGVKSAVRWTMRNPPQPFFGVVLNDFASTIAYVGMGGVFKKGTPDEVSIQEDVNTRKGVERIIRYAFEYARRDGLLAADEQFYAEQINLEDERSLQTNRLLGNGSDG